MPTPSAFSAYQIRYPGLLAYPGWDRLQESLLSCGFDCGPGWLPLIDDTLAALDAIREQAGLAWLPIRQVKEKFGSLVIAVDDQALSDADQARVHHILEVATQQSRTRCERCGSAGTRHDDGWYITLCDACWTAWISEQATETPDI